jgi:hypothetical protein
MKGEVGRECTIHASRKIQASVCSSAGDKEKVIFLIQYTYETERSFVDIYYFIALVPGTLREPLGDIAGLN